VTIKILKSRADTYILMRNEKEYLSVDNVLFHKDLYDIADGNNYEWRCNSELFYQFSEFWTCVRIIRNLEELFEEYPECFI
jgi:hypothetical protein